jgi:hypothetical protein
MASWRDGVSKEAQDDCDRMLDTALPFAQQMLESYGEFYPYAMRMLDNGATEGLTTKPGRGQWPESDIVLGKLYERLAAQAATLRAVAVVADVVLTTDADPIDAIKVDIEHREGVAISVLVPYQKKGEGQKLVFATPRAAFGDRRIWPATEDDG